MKFIPYLYNAKYVIDGDEAARDAMVARGPNGRRSGPKIFINNQHIGGNDDLYGLEQRGTLDKLLSQTKAVVS